MDPHRFGLQHTIGDDQAAKDWHVVVAQQAKLLEDMLHHLGETIDKVCRLGHPQRQKNAVLQAVYQEAERIFSARAVYHAALERQIAHIWDWHETPFTMPPGAAQRLRTMEKVNAILHGNLSLARKWLKRRIGNAK